MNTEFERLDDDFSLVNITVKHKRRDDFSEENKYYPLISDISDVEGVIAEHSELNESDKWLQFALFKDNNNYYFFDVRKNSTELKLYVDENRFICPYCQSSLIAVSSHMRGDTKVPAHLRHRTSNDEAVRNCIFNTSNKAYLEAKKNFYAGEGYKHKRLKMRVYKLAKSGKLKIAIPDEFEIVEDLEQYESQADFTRRDVSIVDAMLEQRVLKKDSKTKGYQPDVVFITDEGEHIYCEITVASGKTVSEYHAVWHRLKKPVIEIKYSENREIDKILNILDTFKEMDYIDENEELFLFNDATVRFLYSPIVDAARKEYHLSRLKLAEKKREHDKARELKILERDKYRIARKELWMKIMKYVDWYREKTRFIVYYDSYNDAWVDRFGKSLWLSWNNVEYNGVTINFKLPDIVWHMLLVNGIKYNKGYKEIERY